MNANVVSVALVSTGVFISSSAVAEVEFFGRVHVDYAIHDEDRRDLDSDLLLRRARAGIEGEINNDWSYEIEVGYDDTEWEAKDLKLEYDGRAGIDLTIGHGKIPFGLESETSSNNTTFVERALATDAFVPGRRLGVTLATVQDEWLVQTAAYGQNLDSDVYGSGQDAGLGISSRLVFSPVSEAFGQFHLAAALAAEEPEDTDLDQAEFQSYPESQPADQRLVDTGNIDNVRQITRVGLEAAWQSGPYSAQWEYLRGDLDRRGAADVGFDGAYVSASWLLTGESRRYDEGRFRSVRPARSSGAWEVAARYSTIDLDDGAIRGGTEDNLTIGLNWYANRQLRFMGNLIFVESEDENGSDDPVIFVFRTQYTF